MGERYILECIKHKKDVDGRTKPVRVMMGLTMSFDMAHYHMEQMKDRFDVILLHLLHKFEVEQ